MSSRKRFSLFLGLMGTAVLIVIYVNGSHGVVHDRPLRAAAAREDPPEIRLPDLEGRQWTLGEQRGKVVLVNFWATWCSPCRREIPDLEKIAAEFRGPGFELVGVAMDEDGPKVVRDFAARQQIGYTILLPSSRAIAASGIETLPTTYLVDKQGRLAKTLMGSLSRREVAQDIRALLAEP
jgi:thiol-disulfide isomerase/thioredoxin